MPQINDFFIDKNRVEGITEEDYERVQPKIEAVAAAARTTTNSIYIIDYYKRNFLYSSENPMLAPVGLKDMGYSLYLDYVPKEEQAMLLEINRAGFEEFSRIDLANKMEFVISYDFHFIQNGRSRMVNHRLTPLALWQTRWSLSSVTTSTLFKMAAAVWSTTALRRWRSALWDSYGLPSPPSRFRLASILAM